MKSSLHARLGGAAAVAAFIDDAVDRLAANPALAARFRGQDLPQVKALAAGAFGARAGGPGSPGAAATMLPRAPVSFSPAELQAVGGGMTEALREQGIATVEATEIVSMFWAAPEMAPPR